MHKTIARASAMVSAAVLIGAGAAAGQPSNGHGDPGHAPRVPDAFAACSTVGTPSGLERFLCYRAAANLANERRMLPRPLVRPIVIEAAGFGWPEAGLGFATAAGLALLVAGTAAARASTGSLPRPHRRSTAPADAGTTTEVAHDLIDP
jgi:hypothetical protein